ncbi:MAG: NAD(+)/NADH kinase, partial [Anaerolineae bacterium]|nr:NAD(+)/NADH kinase [Anaerolineae bacterium]
MNAKIELKKVGIMSHPQLPETQEEGIQIQAALAQMGIDCLHAPLGDAALSASVGKQEIDLLIVLGGDGTVLRAGHLCAPSDVPILAINVGHFGFLIEVKREEWRERLPKLAAGEFWLEERMMLKASIVRDGKDRG